MCILDAKGAVLQDDDDELDQEDDLEGRQIGGLGDELNALAGYVQSKVQRSQDARNPWEDRKSVRFSSMPQKKASFHLMPCLLLEASKKVQKKF